MADPDCVRVAIRIRPLVRSECEKGCQTAVVRTADAPQITVNKTDAFTFNYVFDEHYSQEDVYREAVYDMIDSLFKGYNVTILAYGQTGSGKTHTMGTAFDGNLDSEMGVIPRAMNDIFKRIEEQSEEFEFTVTCSFMELYQEQLFDLLSTKPRDQRIVEMREDRNRIIMPDLTEQVVSSSLETTDCLMRGSIGRAVASTAMNEQSSRSHAIFTVTIKAAKKDEMRGITTSKFHLVDLAGSERSNKTKATGDRFKEGVKINQGLLALGNVISALGCGSGSGYVSYRDSKLTRLLQDSLGGNSVTLMIACVSPADYNVAETLSTLRYADRARKIKNKPIVNQDPHAAEINRLTGIIQKLRMELLNAGGGMSSSLNGVLQTVPGAATGTTAMQTSSAQYQALSKAHEILQEKYRNLQHQLQITLHDVAENEMRAHIAEAAHEQLKMKTDEMKAMMSQISLNVKEEQRVTPEKIEEMRRLVDCIDEELEKTQTEISEHRRRASTMGRVRGIASDVDDDDDDDDGNGQTHSQEMNAFMQEQNDAYTNKQMNFKDQLRRINRELNLKEELHQRVAGNLNKFCTLDDNVEEKFQECAAKIQELEAEKSELLEKLKYVKENASAKLAEERRKRLQTLEQEINDMKRKNVQQAKLLKVREKETLKIQNLHSEIQAMKESKVKLIRAMRQESENFRQWKLTREKELIQLKNKDRKMQNEMARKEVLHTKQRNVLKRKCEEAQAINKRLKDALERQKVAQSMRQKQQQSNNKDTTNNTCSNSKIDQVIAWVERELEVITSLIDAENSLEQLMEDRGIVSNRIGELQQQKPAKNTPAAAELAQLEEELEMRNAQISDLQQKVCANDLDTRMRTICESIQNLAETRAIMKHLLATIAEMRREYANRALEQKAAREAAEERYETAAKRMRLMEIEHEEQIAERETTYEEKISVLLRELHNTAKLPANDELTPEQRERMQIQEEQLNKMEMLRDELDSYKKLVAELQTAVTKSKTRKQKNSYDKNEELEFIEISSVDEDDFEDDADHDPDWKKTPMRRGRKAKRTDTTIPTNGAGNINNSDLSNNGFQEENTSPTNNTTANNSNTSGNETIAAASKRKLGCKCRGSCGNKRCGCYSYAQKCSVNCRCSKSCTNGKHAADNGDDDVEREHAKNAGGDGKTGIEKVKEEEEEDHQDDKAEISNENKSDNALKQSPPTSTNSDVTFAKPSETTFMTPKIARLSQLSFHTASVKKKFFK